MDFDFQKLDWRQFEILCGSLLTAEGFLNVRQFGSPGGADRGVDWVFDTPEGESWVVQVKLLKHRLASPSMLQNIVGDLFRGMAFSKASKALLMLSVPVATHAQAASGLTPDVVIWDARKLEELIEKHQSIREGMLRVIAAQESLGKLVEAPANGRSESGAAEQLIRRLEAVSPGRHESTEYEGVCVEILSFCFAPYLRPPKIQDWSEDGLDRRDAIFPIGSGSLFWDNVKYEYSSRLVVAEFKNYTEPIGQTEVESLQQYLLPKAKRAFGLICSRHVPSVSAIRARRRAWMLSESLVLFLSDGDLKDMARKKALGEEPEEILEAQMNDFFLKLAP